MRRPDHVVDRRRRRRLPARGLGRDAEGGARRAASAATLHAHLVARDDALSLYGFASEEERDLFLSLISVRGVGPKVAIAALSGGPVRELLRAIAAGDAKRFQAVPGIGKRTAERIIVELREKVAGEIEGDADGRRAGEATSDPRSLAREGLLNLGYTPVEAERLLDGAEGETPEEIVQSALRSAARSEGGMRSSRLSVEPGNGDPDAAAAETPSAEIADADDRASAARRRLRPLAAPADARRLRQPGARSPSSSAIFIEAARRRGEALDHVLLAGPPGPRQDLARPHHRRRARRAAGADRRPGAGAQGRHRRLPDLARAGQRLLHRRDPPARPRDRGDALSRRWRTAGCPVVLGQGAGARTVTLDLPPFTLIGATTRAGLLTTPLRDRFGVCHRLEHYDAADLRADRAPLGRDPRGRDRADGGAEAIAAALARHAARRQPAAAAGPRLRRGARRRA